METGDLRSLATSDSPKTAVDFSPDGSQISYAQDNDLFVIDVGDEQIRQLTTDGSATVYNGGLDWVYTEELATRAAQPAYAWSPDGKWFFYMRLDDSDVQSDPTVDYETVPATVTWTRFPTVGSPNPRISLHVLSLTDDAPAQAIPLGTDAEYVLPLFTWTPDGAEVVYMTVNRPQTVLEVKAWNPATGAGRTLLQEMDPTWINEDRYAAPVFLRDGSQFLWLSERDGYMHLYLYDRDGTLVRQVTSGDWMIDTIPSDILTAGHPVAFDTARQAAYMVTTRNTPLERQIDRVDLATGEIQEISSSPGFHAFVLSANGDYLVDQFSDIDTAPATVLLDGDGNEAGVLSPSAVGALTLPAVMRETVELTASDGSTLYAQLVKPAGFDPAKVYPVVVHWYGGTGYQLVSNRYGPTNIFNEVERDTLYTQAGFLVWRLDNRGSFGRGHVFETPIDGALGPVALEDQLVGIDYLRTLPYVDGARIGTDGKSFGGFLTLYGLIHAPDALRCGIAIAGPTDWTYYGTIYTERYMETPEINPEGYATTQLIDKVGELQAAPLLIHGLDDTNVHLQNTINFIQALQEQGKPYLFVPLPNTSHSIKGQNLITVLTDSVQYLEACLLD
ncbi:MAG: DPP IV N-terminal domain-containing protein [Anaerolineales bacterium]|nr:DPP IV N-terminal domain-containing protein [Anaerolineales bacterium]